MQKPIDHFLSCSQYCTTAAGETPLGHKEKWEGEKTDKESEREGRGEKTGQGEETKSKQER